MSCPSSLGERRSFFKGDKPSLCGQQNLIDVRRIGKFVAIYHLAGDRSQLLRLSDKRKTQVLISFPKKYFNLVCGFLLNFPFQAPPPVPMSVGCLYQHSAIVTSS